MGVYWAPTRVPRLGVSAGLKGQACGGGNTDEPQFFPPRPLVTVSHPSLLRGTFPETQSSAGRLDRASHIFPSLPVPLLPLTMFFPPSLLSQSLLFQVRAIHPSRASLRLLNLLVKTLLCPQKGIILSLGTQHFFI